MKVRIKGNSIRFRLVKSEVQQLKVTGIFKEETQFANHSFKYVLEAKEKATHLSATFTNNTLTIYMPKTVADNWFDNEQIGYQHDYEQENGETLFLLIEKDFVCLDETVEDQSDNYPHPLESSINE